MLYALCKTVSPLYKSVTEVMFWFTIREWKHRKRSPWACLFSISVVKFCGTFHIQKLIFLQLLQIWSSYCFHCDADQLWTHTQSNNRTKCLKQILLTVNETRPPICTPFGTKSYMWNSWLFFFFFFSVRDFIKCEEGWLMYSDVKREIIYNMLIIVLQLPAWQHLIVRNDCLLLQKLIITFIGWRPLMLLQMQVSSGGRIWNI